MQNRQKNERKMGKMGGKSMQEQEKKPPLGRRRFPMGAGVLGSGRTDHQTLNLAILTEILDGGHRPDVISVVDGVVIGLGVTDDQGIGDFKPPEQEAVPEKHVNPLGAVSVELRLAGVLGAVVHKNRGGGEELAQGHRVLVEHSLHILLNQSHENPP